MTIPIVMLAGPTGIGKTELAIRLAEKFALEIISADSMQVYRGMEIGTAQPTAAERARARFHLCGVMEPTQNFDVAQFLRLCDAAHADILARGKFPIYVGGTGMYLRALRWGLFEDGGSDQGVRAELDEEMDRAGLAAMHARLETVDPVSASRINVNDEIRIMRALEVYTVTGKPLSELQAQWSEPEARFAHVLVAVSAPIAAVRKRIAARTEAMLATGWKEEVQRLIDARVDPAQHCFKALGYREILSHLRGDIDAATMRRLITTHTGQFARRQLTWLRRERDVQWIQLDPAAADVSPLEALPQLEILLEKLGVPYV